MRHRADGFPFGLKCHNGSSRSAPISAVLQSFGTLAEDRFLRQILCQTLAERTEVLCFGGEKLIASRTEAFKDLLIDLTRGEAHCLPFVLQADDELRHRLPFGQRGESIEGEGFYLLAEIGFLSEVFLFLLFEIEEVVLMALVDKGRCRFEARPHLFAQFFGHRSGLAKLLVQLLKLVESTNHIFHLGELFGRFAEMGFDFEIFLEIIGPHFVVDTQQVVVLLHIVLEVLPRLRHLLGRDSTDGFPLCLQCLEGIVVFVYIVGCRHHSLDFFDDGQFAVEVAPAFGFELSRRLGTVLLDGAHEFLKLLFERVGLGIEVGRITALCHKCLACGSALLVVQTVEDGAQLVGGAAVGRLTLLEVLAQTRDDLLLGRRSRGRALFGRFGLRLFGILRNFRGLHGFGWRFGRCFGSGFRLYGVFTTVEKFGLSRLCFSLSLNRLWLSGSYFELWGFNFTHKSVGVKGL